ncbi:MAG TPA: MCE family protein [Marmoricola sp.]|jgi:virulence factor Mce-like protein|nr:MCE family protein [Marmoricola sp.]
MISRKAPIALVVVLVVGLLLVWHRSGQRDTYTVTASFPQTIGLYAGDGVRVLGVPMGTITSVTQHGASVSVRMRLKKSTPVAADTDAVIVPPGLLASRYVQLTKPWLHGPRLADGAVLAESRTAAPLELDDVTAELDKFVAALGPNGANKSGALSDLVDSSSRALDGNGTALRQTLTDLSNALTTLDSSKGDIVGTIEHLQTFVSSLAGSSAAIATLERGLGDVSTQLAQQRPELSGTIRNVASTITALQTFVRTNGSTLTGDVAMLARLTTTLADRKRDLEEIADLGSLGVEGIFGAANLNTGVLDARVDLTPLLDEPDTSLCQILQSLAVPQLCSPTVPPAPGQKAKGAK